MKNDSTNKRKSRKTHTQSNTLHAMLAAILLANPNVDFVRSVGGSEAGVTRAPPELLGSPDDRR